MSKRRFAWLLAALFIVASVPMSAGPAAAAGAQLSRTVTAWLATAGPDARLGTIVTFNDQAGVSKIDTLGVTNQKLAALPMAYAKLSAAQIAQVASWPEVLSVWHDAQNGFVLDESVPLIKADQVQRGVGLLRGYTGLGVNVAVIDTGVDSTHPDLPAAKTRSFVLAGDPFDKDGVVVRESPTVDTYGHGTHVSSTIAGLGTASGGRFKGVAPGATIYSFKTDAGAVLLDSYALRAFDWIVTHPEAKIRVSSNSWGSGDGTDYNPADPVNVATRMLYDRGIMVAFAASNSGGPNTLNQYATSPWVLSVAAGTKTMGLASFSSRGRIADNWDRRRAQRNNTGIYRPTITAPGKDIEAARSAQGAVMASGIDPSFPMYTTASGTSMATPHVAGVVALMLEARPQLQPRHLISILEGTATNMPAYEIFEVGIGYIDALAAVQAAEKGHVQFPPPINGKTPQFVQKSNATFSGTVLLPDTWALAKCPDDTGLLNHHTFTVAAGIAAVYAEISWPSATDLIYLRLYDPTCAVVAESAALLDIGSVNTRAVIYSNPAPGTYTVGVYGRINAPTTYSGSFSTYIQK
jgi:serine protease AprX